MRILPPDAIPKQLSRWSISKVLELIQGEGWKTDYFEVVRGLKKWMNRK